MAKIPTYEELEKKVKELEDEVIELKQVAKELHESHDYLKSLFNYANAPIIVWDPESRITRFNHAFERLTGYKADEVIGQKLYMLFPEASRDESLNKLEDTLKGEYWESVEIPILRKDGDIRVALWNSANVYSENSTTLSATIAQGMDITERKRAEEALQESEDRYRSILEAVPDSITITRVEDGRYLQVNEVFCQMRGYSREEVLGRTPFDLNLYVNMEDREHLIKILKENGEINGFEVQYRKRDGTTIDTLLSARPLEYAKEDCLLAVVTDVSELKGAQEALKKRLAYEKMLADISTRAVFVEDISRCLDECLEIMGKTLNVSRIYIFEFHHGPGTADNTFEWVSDGIAPQKENLQGIPMKKYRWWMEIMNNNKIINYQDIEDIPGEQEKKILRPQNIKSILVVPLFVNNAFYGFMGFDECHYRRKWLDEDIDILKTTAQIIAKSIETKQAEEALRESEEKYRILVENANDAIFVMQDQKVKFPNPKAVAVGQYLGVDLEQVPFINYIHPEDRDMVMERQKKRIKREEVPHTYNFRLMDREGEELWVELNAIFINWEGKPATLNFLRDITRQRRLEARLQQVRRLEALGTLAGGIAHDFNNLLMGIQGRTSLMLMDSDLPQLHYEELKGIEDIVKSAAGLTKQLLGFARTGKYEVKPTNMNELIHKSSQMFGRTKKETKIHIKYQESIWPVEVDGSQIEQVLLNLYVNAWQAMPGGGELYLQTENVMFDESYSKAYKLSPGKYVKISVTDTGVGMDEATQERIFEPFFTTKEMGRGMGLGLASAYGIIKSHDGIINVFSQKGEGTTFDIYLPASEKEVIEEKKLPEAVLKGTETVFLVDDEDIIVGIGDKILKRMGYDVITAKNGKEAIELYKENKARVDIVVLDMIMPEMGGGETYDRLKEINPNVKVLLSSGYSIEGQANEIIKRGCDGFIQKPFRMRLLSRKIREVLDKE
jgi:two-component system cell cycle sensor histidine kinase/response regulator CckA